MKIEGCDAKMTKHLSKMKIGPSLGYLDLNIPSSEAQQEAQPVDSEKRLKIIPL